MTKKKTEAPEVAPLQLTLPCRVVAKALGISLSGLYTLLKKGVIPSCRIGGRTVVRRTDLEKFVEELPVRPAQGDAAPKKK